MITNKKQSAGDYSVNYMADGNITVHNGFSKEDIIDLLRKVRISHQVQKYAFVSIWIKSTKIFSFVVEGTCSHPP